MPSEPAPFDIERITVLANIALDSDERERLGRELKRILVFVDELRRVDTANVAPMTGGTELVNVMRSDRAAAPDPETSRQLRAAAPRTRGTWIEVPAVFSDRSL